MRSAKSSSPSNGTAPALILLLLLTIPSARGQNPALPPEIAQQLRELQAQIRPSQTQMEFLRREAARLAACYRQVDQAALADLQTQAQSASDAVRAECTAGRREAAQTRALAEAGRLMQHPAALQLQRCDPALGQLMDTLPLVGATRVGGVNVCDLKY